MTEASLAIQNQLIQSFRDMALGIVRIGFCILGGREAGGEFTGMRRTKARE